MQNVGALASLWVGVALISTGLRGEIPIDIKCGSGRFLNA